MQTTRQRRNIMTKKMISYTLPQEELENLLSSEFGTKIEPVDAKQLAKQKMNQQRARQLEKRSV